MTLSYVDIGNANLPVYCLDTLVIGTGCAGYNAADWLHELGRHGSRPRDFAIITDRKNYGTSRNTGSDKQTYYKLSFGGDAPDSVPMMARDLFAGGGMHGDHALAMAAGSARCFFKLANLGVPFPRNEYGEYVGYQTDHDSTARATSAGPLTSKYMTEALEKNVISKGIRIFDNMMAIRLLTRDNALRGLLALDLTQLESKNFGLTLFCVNHVIMATGGPAGVYHRSVFPESQAGMTGMALEAGAAAENLSLWQYGLASTKFRWNVSGTYQQVIPKYISVDQQGAEREFLAEHLDFVFLKGYQWPYDPSKASSLVDRLVYREIHELGRRVFMDFRSDPTGFDFGLLGDEARNYLKRSGALLPTPIARLAKMNPQAIALFKNNGIDLYNEPLEIDVCAQHCNGGLAVDEHWQCSLRGLYAAGEAAGTFGACRPGGSALNAAQVGSMRAAEHIAKQPDITPCFDQAMAKDAEQLISQIEASLGSKGESPARLQLRSQKEFSAHCAHVRSAEQFNAMYCARKSGIASYFELCSINSHSQIPGLLRTRDMLITQAAMLSAMQAQAGEGIIYTRFQDGEFISEQRPVRPVPQRNTWFETVWGSDK